VTTQGPARSARASGACATTEDSGLSGSPDAGTSHGAADPIALTDVLTHRAADHAASGPIALVESLVHAELADLSDAEVLAVVAGWQRLMSSAVAAQADALNELVARRKRSSSFPVDDVACALSTTTYAAQALVARAAGLAAHAVLADALRAGTLDARKADVLLDEVARLPHADADRVLREVVGEGEGLTAPLLRREARRLVAAVDPDAAAKRAAKARTERCVRLEHAGDAMAWVSALLPAADAVAVFSVVDTLARACEGEGDVRTLPQRRADVMADVFAAILADGVTPDGRRLPVRQGETCGLQLTMALSTFTGADDMPGELAGYGPIPAALARDLAGAANRFRPVVTDDDGRVLALGERSHPISLLSTKQPAGTLSTNRPAETQDRPSPPDEGVPGFLGPAGTGATLAVGYRPDAALRRLVLARDDTCVFPGCRQPGPLCDLDHIEPFDPSRPAAAQTHPENLQPLCRHHHLAKTHHGWAMRRDPTTGDVHVTSPLGLEYVRPGATIVLTESAYRHGPRTRGDSRAPGSRPVARRAQASATDAPPPF
jgi:hypothetical protein